MRCGGKRHMVTPLAFDSDLGLLSQPLDRRSYILG